MVRSGFMHVFLHETGGAPYTASAPNHCFAPRAFYIGIATIARHPLLDSGSSRLLVASGALLLAGIFVFGDHRAPVARYEGAVLLAWIENLLLAATFVIALASARTLANNPPSRAHWLAPLPTLAGWLCLTAFACLERMDRIGMNGWGHLEAAGCLLFLLAAGTILSAGLLWSLRRGALGGAGGAMAGVAGASGAAFLLSFRHPFPVDLVDLAEHWTAMVLVIGIAALAGRVVSRRVEKR